MSGVKSGKKMENENKRSGRWKLGVGIAALLAAVSVFVVMLQIEKRALAGYEKTQVYVAGREIPVGMKLTEANYEKYITVREVDAGIVSEGVLDGVASVYEKTPVYTISKGTILDNDMFVEGDRVPEELKTPVVVGVRVEDLFQVAGGILRPGDRVHIVVVSPEGDADTKWENVIVESAFHSSGESVEPWDTTTAATSINLYLEKNQVERFYEELAKGSIRAVKICR